MKRRPFIQGLAGAMVAAPTLAWPSSASSLAATGESLEAAIRAALRDKAIPGAVVAIVDDRGSEPRHRVITHGVRGVDDPRPVSPDTAFDVGSCSKSYVTTAVASLVADGRLDFDEPVKPHVPELMLDDPWVTEHITVRDILCNRTGLKRQVPIESFANPDIRIPEIAGRLQHLQRVYPFRAGYVYFNPGFMIASLLVERVAGMPYARYLEERIFGPLGMRHSASGLRPFEILDDRAAPHATSGGRAVGFNEPVFDNWEGAAGVFSSGNDALRWLRFHLGNGVVDGKQIVNPAALGQTHAPHTVMHSGNLMHRVPEASLTSYCMGWWTSEFHGHRLVMHAGGMFGWRAFQIVVPAARVGVAVYMNVFRRYEAALSYLVIESLLTGQARDWVSIADQRIEQSRTGFAAYLERQYAFDSSAPPSLPVPRLAGRYHHPGLGNLEVEPEGNRLRVRIMDGRIWDSTLTHLGGDVWESQLDHVAVRDYLPLPARMRFRIEGGRVEAVEDDNAVWQRAD